MPSLTATQYFITQGNRANYSFRKPMSMLYRLSNDYLIIINLIY